MVTTDLRQNIIICEENCKYDSEWCSAVMWNRCVSDDLVSRRELLEKLQVS